MPANPGDRFTLRAEDLPALFHALRADGRQIVGPTPRDGAITYAPISGPDALPRGLSDVQSPGRYRLVAREDDALFAYNVGPDSWKKILHPSRVSLWRARREGGAFHVEQPEAPPRYAVLGARACELAAIAVQDKVLLGSGVPDPTYASRRDGLLLIAVQCGQAADTCFCPSMGTGPRLGGGFDLALTELLGPHRFVVEVGSPAGAALCGALPLHPTGEDQAAPEEAAARAEAQIRRRLNTDGLRERLLDAVTGPHWDKVAERCLGCANCTMVCPTCFCTTVQDVTDLTGATERVREWDSCFNTEFSYVHGGSVRVSLGARYRQWLTHKLAYWWDQFGSSGCVGCGRCIAWCPAGIDITAEAERAAASVEGT